MGAASSNLRWTTATCAKKRTGSRPSVTSLALAALLFLFVNSPAEAQFSPSEIAAVRLDWNPTGDVIAVSDGGSMVQIVDPQTRVVVNTLPIMPFPVRALRWSDDGSRLAIGGEYTIQIWDNAWDSEQAILSLVLQIPPDPIGLDMLDSVDWSNGATQILTIALGRVYLWDSRTGQLIRTIDPVSMPIVSAAWSPDGTLLATGRLTGYVLIESTISSETGGADTQDRDAVLAIDWEPTGTTLVVGTNSGVLQAFGRGPGRLGSALLAYTEDPVAIFSLDWHPTLPLLAIGYADGATEIRNARTGDLVERVETGLPVMSVSWSPDGTQLAFANGLDLNIVPAPTLELPTATPIPTETPIPTPTPTATSPPL